MDLYFFAQVSKLTLKWTRLDVLGIFFADYFQYVLAFCLLLFLVIKFKKSWKMILQALISAFFARFLIVEFIRWLWQRPRPFVENNINSLLTNTSPAFPSGHAAFFFAISTIIYLYNKKIGILFFIGSLLICLARVFVGIHWPTDILAGAIIGILSGLVVYKISKRYINETRLC